MTDADDPHAVTEARCPYCGKEWIAIHPADVLPEQLECPRCGIQEVEGEAGTIEGRLDA